MATGEVKAIPKDLKHKGKLVLIIAPFNHIIPTPTKTRQIFQVDNRQPQTKTSGSSNSSWCAGYSIFASSLLEQYKMVSAMVCCH